MGGAERLLASLVPLLRKEFEGRTYDHRVLVLNPEKDVFSAALRALQVPVYWVSSTSRSAFSPKNLGGLRSWLFALRPQWVHAHLSPAFHWVAFSTWAMPRGLRPLLGTTEHAVGNRRMVSKFWTWIDKLVYPRYRWVVAVSPQVEIALDRWLGKACPKVRVIENGLDREPFSTKCTNTELAHWKGNRFLVVMVARLVPAKDHDTALEVLAHLPDRYCMALVGDGPRRRELEEKVNQRGLAGRLQFLGTRNDIPDILGTADCYVHTATEEGFGLSVLEAMAAGLPVVSTRAGGLGPLVEGVGILTEIKDFKALVKGVRTLCEEPQTRSIAIERGQARSLQYDIQKTAKEYHRLYRLEV